MDISTLSPEIDNASETSDTACPICSRVVPLNIINEHVDKCLQTQNENEASDISRTPSSGGRHEKRKQSMLNFGSSPPCRESFAPPAKVRKMDVRKSGSRNETEARPSNITCEMPNPENLTPDKGGHKSHSLSAPLAEVVRPTTIEDFIGQENLVGKDSFLHTILQSGNVPSLIFWGPPGCGKTTLARIIAKSARENGGSKFVQLSAASSGIGDVKEVVKVAKNHRSLLKKKTILFIDEIHRFNKLQQDSFLPHVEDGTITLLGATTENPSFQLNSSLLSRCRVVILEKLKSADIKNLLVRALSIMKAEVVKKGEPHFQEGEKVLIEEEALTLLADLCDGDARSALNGLQLTIENKRPLLKQSLIKGAPSTHVISRNASGLGEDNDCAGLGLVVNVQDVKNCLQKTHLLYDRAGDEHYHCISALHKSMRGSDANASLYWLARMLCAGEDPLYVARRVIRFASEDIGLADPNALTEAVAAFNACHFIGMPECEVILAQAVVYMSRAPKSIEVYRAYDRAKASVKEHKGPLPSVPLHLRNAPTQLMKNLGFGEGYKYNPDYQEPVDQTYLPEELSSVDFFAEV